MATASLPTGLKSRPTPQGAVAPDINDINRYYGLTRAVMDNPGWLPQADPFGAQIEENRRREEAERRFLASQQAMLAATQMRQQAFLNPPSPYANPGQPTPQPGTPPVSPGSTPAAQPPAQPPGGYTPPGGYNPPAGTVDSVPPVGGTAPHGALPAVELDTTGEPIEAGPDARYVQEQTHKEFYAGFDAARADLQEQIWGPPSIGPDGKPEYEATTQKYIGIGLEDQATGYLPNPRIPPPPPEDATEEQKQKYREALAKSWRYPHYEIGADNELWLGNTVPQNKKIQKMMVAAGRLDPNTYVPYGEADFATRAVMNDWMALANERGVSWEQIAKEQIFNRQRLLAAEKARGGGGGGGETNRQISITYSQTSMAAGRSMLAQVLANAIGRAPTTSELKRYMEMLNNAENKSPTRTVTNYVRGGGTVTSTSRTNPSDVDPEAMAREFAAEIGGGDELMSYKATSYLDNLMDMLRGAQNV